MAEKSDSRKERENEVIRKWHKEYENLDELVAKLDKMRWELECLRHLVEQKMADVDRLFNPYPD